MNDNLHVLELDIVKAAVAGHCCFSLGKQTISELTPCFDRLIVERELTRAREMLQLVIKYGALPFVGLRDIREPLDVALKDGICQPAELLDIAAHAYCCESLVAFRKQAEGAYPELDDLIYSLSYSKPLSQMIERCIEPNGEVADNASKKLHALRQQLRQCEGDLHREAQRFIKSHSQQLSDDIYTMRNDRFVVLVKSTDKNSVNGFIHGASASGQTVYMEPEALLLLNNKRLSINNQIVDEIKRILFELSQKVKTVAEDYLANLATLALLDSYNAKALWAKEYDGTVADLGEELIITKARHPLIDKHKVVANTYRIIPPRNTLLITGPNTGGKTVSLKVIGLFVAMTMCGMPVSCEKATIPFFDNLFVDIGDNQSIVESLSTFSAHIRKIAEICSRVTGSSLVLLDELGGGTDPVEGECLAIAVLDYLRPIGPMIVATTHYNRLKTYGKQHEDVMLAGVQFDNELLQPTYRYVEGLSGQSNAIDIAGKLGLDPAIIADARKLKVQGQTQQDKLLEELEQGIAANQQRCDELLEQREAQAVQAAALAQQAAYYRDHKEELMAAAQTEADAYLTGIRTKADDILTQMRETSVNGKLHEEIALSSELNELATPEENPESGAPAEFTIGDYVTIANTHQNGRIESIDKKKVIVNVNGMRITGKPADIRPAKENPKPVRRVTHRVSRPDNLSFELNLIGYHVDEAMPILDKYLDDCLLMNAPYIRIIHGFGTGALRKAIWDHLKHNRYVDEMRLGMTQEGGSGATIVTLKKR